jgi:hypothetical protein
MPNLTCFIFNGIGYYDDKSDEQDKGIQWGLYDKLEDLDFADICILAQSFKDMEAKLNDLKVEAQNIGMKINSQKTKEMRVNPKTKDRLYLGGYEIKGVNKFCYLGRRRQQRCNKSNK